MGYCTLWTRKGPPVPDHVVASFLLRRTSSEATLARTCQPRCRAGHDTVHSVRQLFGGVKLCRSARHGWRRLEGSANTCRLQRRREGTKTDLNFALSLASNSAARTAAAEKGLRTTTAGSLRAKSKQHGEQRVVALLHLVKGPGRHIRYPGCVGELAWQCTHQQNRQVGTPRHDDSGSVCTICQVVSRAPSVCSR